MNAISDRSYSLIISLDSNDFVGFSPWLGENVNFHLSTVGFKDHLVVHASDDLLVNFNKLSKGFGMLFSKGLTCGLFRLEEPIIRSEGRELILMNFRISANHLK